MSCDLYVGKVTDEPDTWVLGTIKRVNTKYAVICQRCEYPFAKCCGVGDFEVYTDSLIKVPTGEIKNEKTSFGQQLDEMTDMYIQVCKAFGVEIMQLKKELSVYVKALQLACEEIKNRDNGFTSAGLKLQKIANEYGLDCKTYNAFFKEQAEKELSVKDD